jgi:hypothetical protein
MKEAIILAAAGGLLLNVLQLIEFGKRPKTERPDFRDWPSMCRILRIQLERGFSRTAMWHRVLSFHRSWL